jgi:hypothetical protein
MMISVLAGCGSKTTASATPTRKYDIVKTINVTDSQNAKWKIYQIRLTLDGGATFTVDLNLANGDKMECYYITEQPATGANVSFQVKAGTSVVYPATTVSGTSGNTSDRLSVTASQTNGSSYRLVFHNNMPEINSKETIYTEIQYPANASGDDSIFIPLETN